MIKLKAYTLSEIVITIAIIGVISTLLIGTFHEMSPNKTKTMFLKSYKITEAVVQELLDEALVYPHNHDFPGFLNTDRAYVNGTNEYYEGNEKFCMFFAKKVYTVLPPEYDKSKSYFQCTFQTDDNIIWYIDNSGCTFDEHDVATCLPPAPIKDCPPGLTDTVAMEKCEAKKLIAQERAKRPHFFTIKVDVNGNKEPNTKANIADKDMFEIIVDYTGKIKVTGEKELQFLKTQSTHNDSKELYAK